MEQQLVEKKQLVMKLIEETNLCNAEVASLQQTVQQAYKAARSKDRDYEKLLEEKTNLEQVATSLQKTLDERQNGITKLFSELQEDTSGNATMDEVDRKVGWKLKMLAPRQHEIRHSVFLVLNRREALDKVALSQGLAHHFAIAASRIEIVEDTRLPDSVDNQNPGGMGNMGRDSGRSPSLDSGTPQRAETPDDHSQGGADPDTYAPAKRDLVLVNIADVEMNEAGQANRSAVAALDVLNQVRNDMLRGQRVGPIEGITVDAIFINHGDLLLPFVWPEATASLLIREGRMLAGKHAVITVHEVKDPYVLRVVAYDTEVGKEFVLYLNTRDILLLLDTRDSEAWHQWCQSQSIEDSLEAPGLGAYRHLEGASVKRFREHFSVADSSLLDVVISSLSFSVWRGEQILVASEMRLPAPLLQHQRMVAQLQDRSVDGPMMSTRSDEVASSSPRALLQSAPQEALPSALEPAPALPELGVTRGKRPRQVGTKRLFEDVLGFEGRLCVFSLTHTTASDLSEDILRAVLYYPKTCAQVEAIMHNPMLSDRLRIVAEAGELDLEDALTVTIVVEEIIYPPTFLIRLTSVSLEDLEHISPQETTKPHSHIIRVTKDGQNAMHLPDISFAITPSVIRNKMLQCIGLSNPVQGPRETLLKMPALSDVLGQEETIVTRAVTGHPSERFGLTLQLVSRPKVEGNSSTAAGGTSIGSEGKAQQGAVALPERGTAGMPPALRAQLRAKHGKGRLLVRHGRMLGLRSVEANNSIRAVLSVYERSQPYQHFVMCAYEPKSTREWEVLADSIDVFRLFADRDERRSQALDLGQPSTRESLAKVLVECLELIVKEDEIVLTVSPEAVRKHVERLRQQEQEKKRSVGAQELSNREPEVTGGEGGEGGEPPPKPRALPAGKDTFDVVPAATSRQTKAVGGFHGGYDRREDLLVEQKASDRLFTAQRRLAAQDRKGQGELYKVCIYDSPKHSMLHSYVLVATPVHDSPLAAEGLPTAILADPSAPIPQRSELRTYTMKIDDRVIEDFLWDKALLEPSRQEELLNYITQNLHLDEDSSGQFRLMVRKKKLRQNQIADAMAQIGETGGKAPAANTGDGMHAPGSKACREIGGLFPLNALRASFQSKNNTTLHGPSIRGGDNSDVGRRLMVPGWKKIYSMAQRFGQSTVVITVSTRELTYRLGVYEPESSALYEMSLVTCSSQVPMNVLMERCDLGGKLDLMLCLHEVAFPHQVSVNLVHIPSSQEFNLKIGDDKVFTMVENSRRDAFMLYFDQLITWGCIGFSVPPGTEEQALPSVFEETFAGNQIFDRTHVEDALRHHLVATAEGGELKAPMALAPQEARKIRVPVIRTQLDFLGKKQPPPAGISMHLLYHGEHAFPKEGQTVLMRVHKRVSTNDIAVTLKLHSSDGHSLPEGPAHRDGAGAHNLGSTAGGRPFETPALAAGEAGGSHLKETTVWLQDKCSRAPCGGYGEFCEIPGFSRPVLLLISDEDSPRAIRICVTLAQLPFTVLFQVVLLESSEAAAKVEQASLKPSSSRRVLQATFQRYFGKKSSDTSMVAAQLTSKAHGDRDKQLRQKLDDLLSEEGHGGSHMGVERGPGTNGYTAVPGGMQEDPNVSVSILYMCTRRKMGRMMVFTIHRDLVAHNMYLRVVVHDPSSGKDSHLTLLHYTTQTLLSILRINRDMLEDGAEMESDHAKQERQTLRAELGKLIVDHIYLRRATDTDGHGEELDELQFPEDEDVDYELRMRDIMDPSNSAQLSAKRKLLAGDGDVQPMRSLPRGMRGDPGSPTSHLSERTQPMALLAKDTATPPPVTKPKTLLDTKEEALVHKAEKEVSGRRVLITFYNETTAEDILSHSHNIRIAVACVQSLDILCMRDFHEEQLEMICERRNKRHLMSAAREPELMKELWDCLVLQHVGQDITGITFGGLEG